VSGHRHEPCEVHGVAATESQLSDVRRTVQGLREDVRAAHEQIRLLQDEIRWVKGQLAELRQADGS